MLDKQPLVSAVVVNYNGMEHLSDCLSSLSSQTYANLEIIVSDDCSTDESRAFIRSNFPSVRMVQTSRNSGFVKTANRGMRSARGDLVILLNNDVECEPDFVERLVVAANANPEVGILAPKMRLFYARSVLNGVGTQMSQSGFGWDRGLCEKDEGQYDEPCQVFGACGGAMLIRKDVLERVGYMDPAFYFLFDDIDLCWRARLLGYSAMTVPDAVIYHKFGGFYGKLSPRKYFLASKNRLRAFLKNYEWGTIRRLMPDVVRADWSTIKNMFKHRERSRFVLTTAMIKSYLWNVFHLPGLYLARRRVQKTRVVSDKQIQEFIYQRVGREPVLIPTFEIVDFELFSRKQLNVDRILMGSSDRDCLGPGWDALTPGPVEGLLYRQTGPKSFFYLRPTSALRQWLNIRVCGAPVMDISGELMLNGLVCGDFIVRRDEGRTLSFPVPSELHDRDVLEGSLVLKQTWQPSQFERAWQGDNRELGAKVYEISLDEKPLADSGLRIPDCGLPIAGLRKVLVLRSARPHFCVRALTLIREDLDSAEVSLLLQQGSERTPYESLVDDVIAYPEATLSKKGAGASLLDELKSKGFDLCVVVYGHMPRSSYKNVEQLARAVRARVILGIPPEGKPVIIPER